MNQELLAEASAVIKLLTDLRNDLESNTVDVNHYSSRINSELSEAANISLLAAENSNKIMESFMPLFVVFLDENTISFFKQTSVMKWLDLILGSLKKTKNL